MSDLHFMTNIFIPKYKFKCHDFNILKCHSNFIHIVWNFGTLSKKNLIFLD